MSLFFTEYHDAYNYAVSQARLYNLDHGVSKTIEFNRPGFVVRMLPCPRQSFGDDLRAERVTPMHPITKQKED